MKRIFAGLTAGLCLLILLTGCTQAGRRTAAQKFINADIEGITAAAREILETGRVPEGLVFDGVERIEYIPENWVAFQTGSREEENDYLYVGFYFSPDDAPIGFRGADIVLEKDAISDKYTWQNSYNRDESYYTEHIQFGWYYYEFYGMGVSVPSSPEE